MSSKRDDVPRAGVGLDASGHLSELALALACEGELDGAAREHLDACDDCATRLADEALVSARVGAGFAALAREAAQATDGSPVRDASTIRAAASAEAARPRAPRGLVAGAAVLLFAMSVPALPGLVRAVAGAPGYARVIVVALVSVLRTLSIFVSRQDVALVCAAVFVGVGAGVAFAASRAQEKKDHALV